MSSAHSMPASASTIPPSVEPEDPVHPAHVEVDGVGAELLAAHRVARAGDADAASLSRRRPDRGDDVATGRAGRPWRHGSR